MDDLFGMLYNDLDPARKLLTAVSNNMTDSLTTIITGGVDVNTVVQVQNGNTALHIASQKGHQHCLEILLKSGANPDLTNQFGFTPLAIGLRHGNVECVKQLFKSGSMLSSPNLIWTSQQMDELPTWLAYNKEIIKVLLLATPDFEKLDEENDQLNIKDRLFDSQISNVQDKDLVKLYFMTGNTLHSNQMSRLLARTDAELSKWIKSYLVNRTLQQQSCISIRRQLHPNTLSGARLLPIPPKIQQYITLEDEF